MTKKLTIFFAVLTAICVVAAVAMLPFAIAETSQSFHETYTHLTEDYQEMASYPLTEGTTTLNIVTENIVTDFFFWYYPKIQLVHSDEKVITVTANAASRNQMEVNWSEDRGTLTVELVSTDGHLDFFGSTQEKKDFVVMEMMNYQPEVQIAIPDGMKFSENLEKELEEYDYIKVDSNVRYLTSEDIVEPMQPTIQEQAQSSKETFANRARALREALLTLVRDNAQGAYGQLDFNMQLNDCRIQMEAMLMEYAQEKGLINYSKYANSSSSTATGLSGAASHRLNQNNLSLSPVDMSLDESETRSLIHEICGYYLPRLALQAKLEYCVATLETNSSDELLAQKLEYETRIQEYTNEIQRLEKTYPEFMMAMMDTGLLF